MPDQVLRHIERRARETGSIDDEAAYLKGRVRAGDLDPCRLRLAARLGHPAAQQLVNDLVIGELIARSSLLAHTASSWGWRTRPEDREALEVVAETVMRFPLVAVEAPQASRPQDLHQLQVAGRTHFRLEPWWKSPQLDRVSSYTSSSSSASCRANVNPKRFTSVMEASFRTLISALTEGTSKRSNRCVITATPASVA